MSKVSQNYFKIKSKVPSDVVLTVVTKKHEMATILEVIKCGHLHFAENYVQEAGEKWSDAILQYPNIVLKLIGRLQSNKIKDALAIFHEIHSIHSIEISRKILKELNGKTRTKVFYAQVNIGNEEQKSGILPVDIIQFFEKCPLKISGLMCIPPVGVDPLPYFLLMKDLKKTIDEKFGLNLKLSMGMSEDFEKAIEAESDEIRVGSAILGERS